MRLLPRFAAGLSFVAILAAGAAAETPSPLRFVPDTADVLLEIKNPRRLVETATNLDALKQLQEFPSVKELLDSTTSRRYYQFLAYFEKELGADRMELLDRLAGNGAVLATKFGVNPGLALLVVQGKDEKLMQKFADTALDVVEQELARQDVKAHLEKTTYEGAEVVHLGKDFHAAVAGATLFLSNNDKALQAALDLYAGKSKKSMSQVTGTADAAKLLPADPLATLWINYETVKQQQAVKDFYNVRLDIPGTIIFGTLADTLYRSPFVCAALCQDKDGLLLTARMPRGRDGMGAIKAIYLPPEGQPGCRAPLTPKGVLYSESFYMDPAPFWNDRAKLFSDQQIKAMEETDKNSGRFLSGLQLSKLLTQAGPYHRVVVAEQESAGYRVTPKQHIPAFGVVTEMRDPETFGRNLETILRGAALFATTQVKMKMGEETYKDCEITTYRFVEDAPYKADVNDLRFNFTPTFTKVGNQFVVASTVELCRGLVDELQKEAKEPPAGVALSRQIRVFPGGVADLVKAFEDSLVTQTILDQAVPPAEAKEQVKAFLQWVRGLGEVNAEEAYTGNDFRFDLRWKTK